MEAPLDLNGFSNGDTVTRSQGIKRTQSNSGFFILACFYCRSQALNRTLVFTAGGLSLIVSLSKR